MAFGDFLSGVWDSVTGAVTNNIPVAITDLTNQEISNVFSNVQQQFGSNYIAAQNAATSEMGRALSNFNASKPHSGADYQSFENEIQGISNTFTTYAQGLNSTRAMRGARDVANLASTLIRDRESERQQLGIAAATTPVTTSGTWQTGTAHVSGGITSSPYFWPAVGIAAFLLLRRR